MSAVTPIRKGEIFDFTIDRLAVGGDAISRAADGRTVFVDRGFPGQTLRAEIVEDKPRFLRAKAIVAPPFDASFSGAKSEENACAYSARCGGCRLWGASYADEFQWKTEATIGSVERIAKDLVFPAPKLIAANKFSGYRGRARFRIGSDGTTGFFAEGSHDVVSTSECLVLAPELDHARRVISPLLSGVGSVTSLFLEVDRVREGVAATIEFSDGDHTSDVRKVQERIAARRPFSDFSAISLATSRRLIPIVGDARVLRRRHFRDRTVDCRDEVTSFSQANLEMNEVLVNEVLRQCLPSVENASHEPVHGRIAEFPRFLELFCGSGNFSFALAALGAHVDAVEGSARAVTAAAAAWKSAEALGDPKLRFHAADLTLTLPDSLLRRAAEYSLILADPARGGISAELLTQLASTAAKTFVYVSCDPPALARDASRLARFGFKLDEWTLIDMFPRTMHIEAVARFVR